MKIETDWAGTVREIHVSIGDSVEAEQELFTLESMKMFQPILAPTVGRVTAIHVEVDDFVNPGTPLATIE